MSCTAAWNQKTFRGRNDDGDETTATWKATQGTDFSQIMDTNFRIRFEVQETAGCAKNNVVWRLQYNLNGAGWNTVTGASSVVRSSASPNLADAANLTNQLTVGTGTFQGATGFDEVNGDAGGSSMDLAASGHAEAEYCVQIRSADVVAGDTVQLRITDSGTAFAAYDDTPSITVSSGNVTVTPTTLALTTATFAPVIKHTIVVPVKALAITTYAPSVSVGVLVTPSTAALTTTTYAPVIKHTITVPTKALVLTTYAPSIGTGVVPGTASLTITSNAPIIGHGIVIPTATLTTSTFAPTVTVAPAGGGAVSGGEYTNIMTRRRGRR